MTLHYLSKARLSEMSDEQFQFIAEESTNIAWAMLEEEKGAKIKAVTFNKERLISFVKSQLQRGYKWGIQDNPDLAAYIKEQSNG